MNITKRIPTKPVTLSTSVIEVQAYTRIQRLRAIHQCLQSKLYPNCTELAHELNTSAKTIQREINYMRRELDLPIDYDEQRHGYYYTAKVEGDFIMGKAIIPRVRTSAHRKTRSSST